MKTTETAGAPPVRPSAEEELKERSIPTSVHDLVARSTNTSTTSQPLARSMSAWKRKVAPGDMGDHVVMAAQTMKRSKYVIDPRISKFMPWWDMAMVAALVFTLVVTPFEVAFIDGGKYIDTLFYVNRIVDISFMVDMVLTFHLAFPEKASKGGHWEFKQDKIAIAYLKGWFIVDLVSVFPFWCLTLEWHDMFGNLPPANITGEESITFERTAVIFRVVRLLRLLKLARVLKASRILQRHLLDVITNYLELTYSVLELLKLVVILIVWSHWQACLWGLISGFMADLGEPNWLTQSRDGFRITYPDVEPTAVDECERVAHLAPPRLVSPQPPRIVCRRARLAPVASRQLTTSPLSKPSSKATLSHALCSLLLVACRRRGALLVCDDPHVDWLR